MKHALAALLAAVSLTVLGCGDTEALAPEDTAPPEGQVSQQGTCTALCEFGGTISCTGTTCVATDYSGVSCDGAFTACPDFACPGGQPQCSEYEYTACSTRGREIDCCEGNRPNICLCAGVIGGRNQWLCFN
ncbi:hypothetical protein A176_004692 [Myxococcus hansupus]|uniref:Lipoprotein n=1 Tax=Pseudomyxococcus hansupus TaxID=1297742 RepID=A0A0H4X2A7_9BACT|nr:hypothetical protein [Myxococcus hansupus]AKQ67780.1 hypothetical protein A176_004692 [Myxococcus hansupus]